MLRRALSLLSGSLSGLGLLIFGMTDTQKVQGFLAILGAWDPTLAFVMGGALRPMALAWRLTSGRQPLVGGAIPTPSSEGLDRELILGVLLLNFGWALAGLCPGPALASLSFSGLKGAVFVAAMAVGKRFAPRLRFVLDRRPANA